MTTGQHIYETVGDQLKVTTTKGADTMFKETSLDEFKASLRGL